jgi:pimeloyl-ACP methyl ester carboxylesterase
VKSPRAEPLRLAYSDPRGTGTPLLFIHGISHNRSVWEKLANALPDGFRPISIDLRGHGESPWSTDARYGLEDYAADLPALLDHLKIEQTYIVAHSLGGNVATLFSAAHSERVFALILVDTGPALESTGTLRIADEIGSAIRSYASIDEFREQLDLIHPSGDSDILDRLACTGVARRLDGRFEPTFDPGVLGAGVVSTDLAQLERKLWSALGRVNRPVLVVRGGLSAVLNEKVAAEMVDEVLAEGQQLTLPDAGHAIMIDDGPGLRAALLDFVSIQKPA